MALHFMVHPNDFGGNTVATPGYILLGVLERDPKSRQQSSFLQEVVPVMVGGGKGFAKVIRRNLVQSRPMISGMFQCTLNVIGLLLLLGPSMDADGGHSEILLALATAAQRYECYGCLDEQTDPNCGSMNVAKGFLNVHA